MGKFRELLPPWSGRGDVPDGSKPYLPDYSPYVVNMASVRVRRTSWYGWRGYSRGSDYQCQLCSR